MYLLCQIMKNIAAYCVFAVPLITNDNHTVHAAYFQGSNQPS